MSFKQLFFHSMTSPKKLAAYRLMPIGKVFQYVFIFVIILSILSFIHFTTGFNENTSSISGLLEYIDEMEWILYPFAFIIQFVMSTLLVFIRISLMAYVGLFILKLLQRKGDYRHVWRTTAFAYTLPTILSIILLYFGLNDSTITAITTIICLIYQGLALNYYPKR